MIRYKYDEELWYRKQQVLFHHYQSNDTYSIVYFKAKNKQEIGKFESHPNYFSSIGINIYLKVRTEELFRLSPAYTNREAVFLLTEEE